MILYYRFALKLTELVFNRIGVSQKLSKHFELLN